ncbi:TIGR02281 family clan AA aspartic protease [Polyangium jinanense]|uniref:TIGR02281 family clan AA aspartic protease n=1 Tax=Polyangium jinanense TaxID=2829994 RepID=A0A9X3X697_9BACT|nr:TIGR02281 family clan AA aspartic protease [Polyangium jinanense]MDC3982171.1 TIGR02281 family clan AA aspartic protease [Polyangium jinanense]
MQRPVCQAHPGSSAVASCSQCFVALCAVCRQFDGMQALCPNCKRKQRRAPLVRALVALVVLGGLGGGGYWAYRTYQPRYDYGAASNTVHKLESELQKEPCDRPKTLELLETMLAAGDSRGVVARAATFTAACGEYVQTRRITYRAHQRLGEADAAAADLTELVNSDPYQVHYRAWRGVVYQEKGDLDRAAEDFRQALLLHPKLSDIPLNLATVYEKQGKPCEAAFPLQQLVFHHSRAPWTPGIRTRIADLLQKGGCSVVGEGRAALRMEPGQLQIRAKVRLDDKETASFVVDTGASYVTLPRALAEKLGLHLAGAPKVVLQTANGQKDGLFILVGSIAVDKLAAKRVPAVVVDDLGAGVEGLLGLSFLSRFELKQADGVIEIAVPTP